MNMFATEETILGGRNSRPSAAGGDSVLCFGQVTGFHIPKEVGCRALLVCKLFIVTIFP